ncbi:MAG: DUF1343 domain-containing protein [Nitrososphaeria archaeon]
MQVYTGLDVFLRRPYAFLDKKRKIGLVINQTSVTKNLEHAVDAFRKLSQLKLTALFSPEHGIWGDIQDELSIPSYFDKDLGLMVYSLFGAANKPTPEMLSDVDVLIYDIQDVGSRYYTYISTLFYSMEAAAENNLPFLVLDRPNPINGISVEGNILEPQFRSFVGIGSIPIRHGMTVGELAAMFNKEYKINANLMVVKMEGWRRAMWFDDTGLVWVPPSPNMPTLNTATIYPGTCLLEGTNVSEGRGTTKPFEVIGAPWINYTKLSENLNARSLPGLLFRKTCFIPTFSKYAGKRCYGIQVHVVNREICKPVEAGLHIIDAIYKYHSEHFEWRKTQDGRYFFDLLMGSEKVRQKIEGQTPISEIVESWRDELLRFMSKRREYLLYQD